MKLAFSLLRGVFKSPNFGQSQPFLVELQDAKLKTVKLRMNNLIFFMF